MLITKEGKRARLVCDICGSEKNVKEALNGDFCSECPQEEIDNYDLGDEL